MNMDLNVTLCLWNYESSKAVATSGPAVYTVKTDYT